MTAANFQTGLAFVWSPGRDSPRDGYHVTPGDAGGGTKGGIIEATWAKAVAAGMVKGGLAAASDDQLSTVLHAKFWSDTCDQLPAGLDLLFFNGRMMTGYFSQLFQQCLGYVGADVDGNVGPSSIGRTKIRDAETLIHAVTGVHTAYLSKLTGWRQFGGGWSMRLESARAAALLLTTSGASIA